MKHLEIEMKTLLSKEEYDRLLAQFSKVTPVTQKNYYLDTPYFYLRHHKIAMRIRTFDTSAELTIKIPQEVGALELNQNLTPEETENILQNNKFPTGEILETLLQKEIPIQDLKILGSLETIRYEKEDEIHS